MILSMVLAVALGAIKEAPGQTKKATQTSSGTPSAPALEQTPPTQPTNVPPRPPPNPPVTVIGPPKPLAPSIGSVYGDNWYKDGIGFSGTPGEDCIIRWQQTSKTAYALAASNDQQAAAQILHQFVLDTDRSHTMCPCLPLVLNRLGSLEQDLGHYQSAERLYRRAIALLELRPTDVELARALNNLASAYLETGRAKQGEPFRRRSLSLRITLLGENSPDVALGYSNLAADLFQERRYVEAHVICRKALAIWAIAAPDDIRITAVYASLALICIAQRNYGESVELAEKAVRTQEQKRPNDTPFLPRYSYILALALLKQGRLHESSMAFQRALDYLTAERSPNLGLEADVLQNYIHLLRRLGSKADAKALTQRAQALRSRVGLADGLGYSVSVDDLSSDDKPHK
jgi:tetratricopeptide (TPR) repeat protein